jgi:hypothetical protein
MNPFDHLLSICYDQPLASPSDIQIMVKQRKPTEQKMNHCWSRGILHHIFHHCIMEALSIQTMNEREWVRDVCEGTDLNEEAIFAKPDFYNSDANLLRCKLFHTLYGSVWSHLPPDTEWLYVSVSFSRDQLSNMISRDFDPSGLQTDTNEIVLDNLLLWTHTSVQQHEAMSYVNLYLQSSTSTNVWTQLKQFVHIQSWQLIIGHERVYKWLKNHPDIKETTNVRVWIGFSAMELVNWHFHTRRTPATSHKHPLTIVVNSQNDHKLQSRSDVASRVNTRPNKHQPTGWEILPYWILIYTHLFSWFLLSWFVFEFSSILNTYIHSPQEHHHRWLTDPFLWSEQDWKYQWHRRFLD